MAARYLLLALILTGCARQEPRVERVTIREAGATVLVPVPVPCAIEPALLEPLGVALPEFILANPPAVSGLTAENETRLQALLAAMDQRLRGWKVWAEGCGTTAAEAPDR